jgi:hypothetical protein
MPAVVLPHADLPFPGSLSEFQRLFRDDTDCAAYLEAIRWRDGFVCGWLEADETFIGGRGDPTSRGRSTANPDKSLVVAAVEKVPAPKNKKGKHGHAVKRQHRFFAGNARIAVSSTWQGFAGAVGPFRR